MYTPSCTASNSRANAAPRVSTVRIIEAERRLFRRRLWRRRMRREAAGPFFFVGGPDVAHRSAGSMHLHRVTRDVNTHGSCHAVRFPLGHVAVRVARGDEAIFVAAMAAPLAPAVARHVAEDLGMFRGERVRRAHDLS